MNCKSNKKCFESEQAAVDFERMNREKYGLAAQHAYKCEECEYFHLTALPPGTESMARVNYGNFGVVSSQRKRVVITPEQEHKARELHKSGLSIVEIQKRLGLNHGTDQEGSFYQKLAALLRENKPIAESRNNKASIETIAQRKERLRLELEKLELEEERLRQFNLLRVTADGEKVHLQKCDKSFWLMRSEVNELVEMLMYLFDKKPEPAACK
jgi:hypothetical protein